MRSEIRGSWAADPSQSFLAGMELRGLHVDRSQHPLSDFPAADALWAELIFISVCHATNWDQLHAHIIERYRLDPTAFTPQALLGLTPSRTFELLGAGLDRPGSILSRHRLLVSLAQCADQMGLLRTLEHWSRVGVVLAGDRGLYQVLDQIPAFAEDPLKKKARVFVHQISSWGLATVRDPDSMAPAVDYHLIRLYMRTNRVYSLRRGEYERHAVQRVADPAKLLTMRRAVEEAMRYTADGAGLIMSDLNHIEWQVARSFCVREGPRCDSGPLPAKPVDAELAAMGLKVGGCPLRQTCLGRTEPLIGRLQEPLSTKSHY